jgi:predicted nucleic acid-binding protein
VIVLDTSLLVAHLRGQKKATAFLVRHEGDQDLVVPALAAWELWREASTPDRAQQLESMLESMTVEPFMPAMAKLAADMHHALEREGLRVPHFDLLIAAHAVYHQAALATLDADFDAIRGLRVLRP